MELKNLSKQFYSSAHKPSNDVCGMRQILYVGMDNDKGRELIGLRAKQSDGRNQRFTPEAQLSQVTVWYGTVRYGMVQRTTRD